MTYLRALMIFLQVTIDKCGGQLENGVEYGTYRGVRYRLTEVSGTGIDVVPNLPKCPVPVFMYRTYRSVRHRYWCRTELTEVSGTGIHVIPNLPKCPVPVLMSYRT